MICNSNLPWISKHSFFFLFDLADSCLGMSAIDLLSYLSWSALNSTLMDSLVVFPGIKPTVRKQRVLKENAVICKGLVQNVQKSQRVLNKVAISFWQTKTVDLLYHFIKLNFATSVSLTFLSFKVFSNSLTLPTYLQLDKLWNYNLTLRQLDRSGFNSEILLIHLNEEVWGTSGVKLWQKWEYTAPSWSDKPQTSCKQWPLLKRLAWAMQ